MRFFSARFAWMLAAFAAIGCAASTAGGGGGRIQSYRQQVGLATPGDLASKTRHILVTRYQYQMEREDSSTTQQFYETRWRKRYPFQDEIDSGAVDAETRIRVTGRARGGGGAGTGNVRVVELVAENRVLMRETQEWRFGLMTPLFKEYLDEITRALKEELERGIRVF